MIFSTPAFQGTAAPLAHTSFRKFVGLEAGLFGIRSLEVDLSSSRIGKRSEDQTQVAFRRLSEIPYDLPASAAPFRELLPTWRRVPCR